MEGRSNSSKSASLGEDDEQVSEVRSKKEQPKSDEPPKPKVQIQRGGRMWASQDMLSVKHLLPRAKADAALSRTPTESSLSVPSTDRGPRSPSKKKDGILRLKDVPRSNSIGNISLTRMPSRLFGSSPVSSPPSRGQPTASGESSPASPFPGIRHHASTDSTPPSPFPGVKFHDHTGTGVPRSSVKASSRVASPMQPRAERTHSRTRSGLFDFHKLSLSVAEKLDVSIAESPTTSKLEDSVTVTTESIPYAVMSGMVKIKDGSSSWKNVLLVLFPERLCYFKNPTDALDAKSEPPSLPLMLVNCRECASGSSIGNASSMFEVITPAQRWSVKVRKQRLAEWLGGVTACKEAQIAGHKSSDRSGSDCMELRRQIQQVAQLPGNNICADCMAVDPKWASVVFGVFLCIACSGIHRGLGVHISRIRSVDLDDWTEEEIEFMRSHGNKHAILAYEVNLPVGTQRPDENSSWEERSNFIRLKYNLNPPAEGASFSSDVSAQPQRVPSLPPPTSTNP
eukprot:CAMPEP_0177667626 /NCGR_PEP_ID=MMETSP0447-20121125/22230_1 /TAXON_ID=0 /ORGANISM="Stygamoeba regulata, Strain BSH-02190019" /LENGTH=510 /DNA_ID=CAMNT_0019173883 /DNA_START=65 /DNA_END=1593 /DNA_ORIENTATION=-